MHIKREREESKKFLQISPKALQPIFGYLSKISTDLPVSMLHFVPLIHGRIINVQNICKATEIY